MKPPAALMETAIYANDLDAAEAFYRDVFGLEVVRRLPGQFVFFKCGRQMLLVFDPQQSRKATPDNPIPRHGATRTRPFLFLCERQVRSGRLESPLRGAWNSHRTLSPLAE